MIKAIGAFHSSVAGAKLGYKGTMESLQWTTVVMTFIATPMFYLLFFFLVRLQSIPAQEMSLFLLLSILILPTGSCIFYLGSSFHKLKAWGILKSLLLAERSLLSIALHQSLVSASFAFAVSCFWVLMLEIFFIDTGMMLGRWMAFVGILLLSCMVFNCFGILCATLILPLKEHLVVTNSMFFVVIIFSGLMIQVDSGFLFWLSHMLPVTPFVTAVKHLYVGENYLPYVGVALSDGMLYLLLSGVLLKGSIKRLLSGDSNLN